MTGQLARVFLVLLGLLILAVVAWWCAIAVPERFPRIARAFQRLGDAVLTFALGTLGFLLVVVVLRAFGWIPSP